MHNFPLGDTQTESYTGYLMGFTSFQPYKVNPNSKTEIHRKARDRRFVGGGGGGD